MGKKRNAYRVLMGKPEKHMQLRRQRRIWEDNTKMEHKYDGRRWTGSGVSD
jgi:hypothetical protein